MSNTDHADPVAVGDRLRLARESAGIRQSDAAAAIGIARTTLVAIEQGQRRVRMPELQQLALRYGTTVNALLRQEAVHVDLVPRFRRLPGSTDSAAEASVLLLSSLAQAEAELENILGITRVHNYPPEHAILPGDVRVQAELDALDLRHRLGLGAAPVRDIITLLELEMGVRVYVRRMDGRISGLFAYDDTLGPCMLLNASHPRERRTSSAAHECGHLVSTRRDAEILRTDEPETSREERYASAFGKAFVMPARVVMQKWQDITVGSDKLTRRHIILLAHFFGVSREAMVRRLEELKLTKEGAWDHFAGNGGITDEQARQVLGELAAPDPHRAEAERPTTLRIELLAAQAYRDRLLSEGQLAHLLCMDRVELRSILDSDEGDPGGTDWRS